MNALVTALQEAERALRADDVEVAARLLDGLAPLLHGTLPEDEQAQVRALHQSCSALLGVAQAKWQAKVSHRNLASKVARVYARDDEG